MNPPNLHPVPQSLEQEVRTETKPVVSPFAMAFVVLVSILAIMVLITLIACAGMGCAKLVLFVKFKLFG